MANANALRNPIRVRLEGEDRKVILPVNPEEIRRSGSGRIGTFETLVGSHEHVTGSGILVYSWSSFLPGRARRRDPYVNRQEWEDPRDIAEILRDWERSGRVISLVISWWGIRERVFIASFEETVSGGYGDMSYSIELHRYRHLSVARKGDKKKKKKKRKSKDKDERKGKQQRTYTVKAGDTLPKIAKRFLGSAKLWRDIYEIPANKKAIGKDPDNLEPGTELVIPKKDD